MEHVSTLCAAGTIGIAATGFALGRPSPPKQRPMTARKRQSLLTRSYHSPSESIAEPRPATAAHPALPRPDSSQPERMAHPFQSQESQTLPNTLPLRQADRPPIRPRRRTYVGPGIKISEGDVVDELEPPNSSRPSSSWVRRLSIITSSLNGSSLSGSRPQSPSVTGSTTPFFPSNYPAPSPNKLVKRSTSSHGPSSAHRLQKFEPATLPVLRRPATSHQRSANMRRRSSTDSRVGCGTPKFTPTIPSTEENSPPTPTHSSSWRPYFSRARFSYSSDRSTRRRAPPSRNRNQSPRRLVAHSNVAPTLLLASSILPPGRKTNSSSNLEPMARERYYSWNASETGDAAFASRSNSKTLPSSARPPSQDVFREPFASSWETPKPLRRQSSFSHDDAQLDTPSSDFYSTSKSERLHGNSIRVRRRGNITDPDIFRRPSTSSQVEFSASRFDRIGAAADEYAPKSRLRHCPNFTDLRCEALNPTVANPDIADIRARQSIRAVPPSCPNSPVPDSPRSLAGSPASPRHSAAASDPASTLIGSDNDIKVFSSGEDDDTDFQSDIGFDSFPTRVAGSSKANRRGPRIETIFDQSVSAPNLVSLQAENYPIGFAANRSLPFFPHDKRLPNLERHTPSPRLKFPERPGQEIRLVSNSPQPQYSRGLPKIQSMDEFQDEMDACASLDEQPIPNFEASNAELLSTLSSPKATDLRPLSSATLGEDCEKSSRLCLYDWSEQQKVKKDEQGSEPRPRTSHIDQLLNLRGGRTVLRRTSSSLHLRSQSVPISRDPNVPKETSAAKKFATWGLGNKGASEEWDGDFDFEDNDRPSQANPFEKCQSKSDKNQTVRVPQAIMERQESVYGQFSHVQELTVLVEELKLLRARARAMHIIDGPASDLWKEAQGIISLATFEEEDNERELRMRRSTSSLTFSLEDFEIESGTDKRLAGLNDNLAIADDDSFVSELPPPPRNGKQHYRPRTDSSTKAKFVLDTIHRERKLRENVHPRTSIDGQQKLAFDTQSLRDLVVRAGVVTRALKDVVRKAEGVCLPLETDHRNTPDPPFSKIFNQPRGDSVMLGIHS
ncbi:hypothetical protein LOZ12_004165 [Ophidiomyces ophidiicola]|nr:hypothetical protein LOZ62_006356 [Ophidiomyces ophidiicola]KAI1954883.1 hypothetical protein LOZ59_004764 [Ophidiomyces ophidiicola]KAI1969727.1 hypothetical protein LOZ56_004219 [Ophidiomyces ophidiicola]KAI2021260.1 hypothetical protein LOZ45_004807 [Ophidiomyces ophidiicola]KAI2030967.1 hypothetical protein LOZ48_002994 [Ophidiomyces ophidiicola]